jgi:hypothetical protein
MKQMSDYFSEKAHQVLPDTVTAFDIEISSRYGKAWELVELLNFAQLAAEKGVAQYVKKVFYNSQCSLCSFELDSRVSEGDSVAEAIFEAATETITSFDWFGEYHTSFSEMSS